MLFTRVHTPNPNGDRSKGLVVTDRGDRCAKTLPFLMSLSILAGQSKLYKPKEDGNAGNGTPFPLSKGKVV